MELDWLASPFSEIAESAKNNSCIVLRRAISPAKVIRHRHAGGDMRYLFSGVDAVITALLIDYELEDQRMVTTAKLQGPGLLAPLDAEIYVNRVRVGVGDVAVISGAARVKGEAAFATYKQLDNLPARSSNPAETSRQGVPSKD